MYVGVSKVTSRGQVTLPQQLREQERITEGSEVVFFRTKNGIILMTDNDLDSMFELFSGKAKALGVTKESLGRDVKKARGK